jgi:hypothetical protein
MTNAIARTIEGAMMRISFQGYLRIGRRGGILFERYCK